MNRPLRFCLVTTFYPPYNFGGDGIDVQRWAQALYRRGHDVTVVHEIDAYQWLSGRAPVSPAHSNGIDVVGLHSRAGVLSPLLTHQVGGPVLHRHRLRELFRTRNFDVVSFNNVSLIGGPGLLSFGGDALRLYLAHEHWLVCPTHVLWRYDQQPCSSPECLRCVLAHRRPPQLWRHTGALERQLEHIDAFIARSEFSRQKHRDFGFLREMEILPAFLPGELPDTPPAPTGPPPHSRPYFLFVGRLEPIKGLDTILPTFSRYQDADLLVAGDGEQEHALKAMAAGNPRIRFLGRVPNEALARYYQHAIAAVVPSVGFETFGVVLIEAFRFGTPVIARRIGPFPEIVEQSGGGELFGTEDELRQAIERLQRDRPHRDAMGRRAYLACRARWSEDVVVNRYLEIVESAARARAERRGSARPSWLS